MDMATDIKKLGEDIVASYDMRVKAIGELVKDTHKMLKGFDAEHKEMSADQAEALTNFVADLTKNVDNMIKGFQKENKDMANALKESLEKEEADRLKTFKGMMGNIKKGIKDIEAYVKNKLKEFSDAHADMSEMLKKDLAKYVADVVSTTKKLLAGFADERENMAANWQALIKTMAKKRSGKPVVSAGAEVKTVEEAVAEKGRGKKEAGKTKARESN